MTTNITAQDLEIASVCAEAISMMNQGFFNELISIPANLFNDNADSARAYKIVDAFKLQAYVVPTKQKD
jgi:hypothetical protein